mmetsp:Transcript_68855/g.195097  ORF Transcript_68855/g.195097 Transcript_68855/m.195097 type:complete len:264 (-) Transcript_68855:834-1625(-)
MDFNWNWLQDPVKVVILKLVHEGILQLVGGLRRRLAAQPQQLRRGGPAVAPERDVGRNQPFAQRSREVHAVVVDAVVRRPAVRHPAELRADVLHLAPPLHGGAHGVAPLEHELRARPLRIMPAHAAPLVANLLGAWGMVGAESVLVTMDLDPYVVHAEDVLDQLHAPRELVAHPPHDPALRVEGHAPLPVNVQRHGHGRLLRLQPLLRPPPLLQPLLRRLWRWARRGRGRGRLLCQTGHPRPVSKRLGSHVGLSCKFIRNTKL